MNIADTVPFKLTIWLPVLTTDLKIELLAPYETTAVFTFCNPQLSHIGNNIQGVDAANIVPVFEAKNGDYKVSMNFTS